VGKSAELSTVLHALTEHQGVELIGPAGAGKTRLADEVVDRLRHLGHAVVRCSPTLATSAIPFGAFASLLPASLSASRPLSEAADHLVARGRKLVLVVDDAHLLDDASAALVRHVIRRGSAKVLLTAPFDWSADLVRLDLATSDAPPVDLTEVKLGERHRDALELVAFSEPVELYLLVELTSAEVVDALDAKGLLRVTADGKRMHVRLGHPAHAAQLRALCPPSRARAHQQALAERLEDIGVWRREDTLRVATWRLASGTRAPVDLLARAAEHAWQAQDWALTERLCRAAVEQGGLKEVGLLLGTVLTYRRASDEADRVLAATTAVSDDPRLHDARAYTLFVGLAQTVDDFTWPDPDEQRCATLLASGRLDLAEAMAAERLAEVIAGPTWCPPQAAWRIPLATCARLRGRAGDAVRAVEEAVAANHGLPLMPDVSMLAELAMGLALRGRPEQAAYALARADAAARPAWQQAGRAVELARAWVLASAGRVAEAAQVALDVACLGGTHEVVALHDAARFGADTAERLDELAWSLGDPLTRAFAAHARGRVMGDPVELAAVAVEFTRMGVILHAVEALAEAVRLTRAAGRLREAATFGRRLAVLLDRCDDVTTPALLVSGLTGLTPRQLEVARLAMTGLTNQQIADHLRTSKRTVDNHLYATYTALGVRGRAELTGVMRP
jgi:DNA-binding CsgD family transcriptional regulator